MYESKEKVTMKKEDEEAANETTFTSSNEEEDDDNDDVYDYHHEYSLLKSLRGSRNIRKAALEKRGSIIDNSTKSSSGWIRSILVIKERAVDTFVIPLVIVTINAIIWSILLNIYPDELYFDLEAVRATYNLVLTTALAFLLVFRLNRVAVRWWDTRTMWGVLVADARILTSHILEHMNHTPEHRDDAISWLATFLVSVKQHLRNEKSLDCNEVAGFIDPIRLANLEKRDHPPLYLAANIRHSLKKSFTVTFDTPTSISVAYTSEMKFLEKYVDNLILNMGGLERVKATPLPMVYVAHLRTFLIIYLLSMPYFYGHIWGYGTIPIVILIAFILLGIDGGAAECESPFKLRPNHLPMDKFCLNALDNIEALYIESAMRRKQSKWC